MSTPLFCLTVCTTWDLANPTALPVPYEEGQNPSAVAQEECGQASRLCWLPGGRSGHVGLAPTTEGDLAVFEQRIVLHCGPGAVFPIHTLISKSSGHNVWPLIPGDRQHTSHAQQKFIIK